MTRAPVTRRAARQALELYAPDGSMTPIKERRKPVDRETPIHMAILKWLRVVLPKDTCSEPWHTPNGGQRSAIAGKKLKDMGTKAGIPDLCFLRREGNAGRMYYIEVKAHGETLSAAQVEAVGMLEKYGAYVAVAHSVDEARDALRKWGIRTTEIGNFAPVWRTPT
jgi:hypothetical protein